MKKPSAIVAVVAVVVVVGGELVVVVLLCDFFFIYLFFPPLPAVPLRVRFMALKHELLFTAGKNALRNSLTFADSAREWGVEGNSHSSPHPFTSQNTGARGLVSLKELYRAKCFSSIISDLNHALPSSYYPSSALITERAENQHIGRSKRLDGGTCFNLGKLHSD